MANISIIKTRPVFLEGAKAEKKPLTKSRNI